MGREWFATQFPGVRYRKHSTRKHGVNFDRYFVIRYKIRGRLKEEAPGWGSDGWPATSASEERAQLMRNARLGEGATSLKEKREKANRLKQKQKRATVTFSDVFTNKYFTVTSPE